MIDHIQITRERFCEIFLLDDGQWQALLDRHRQRSIASLEARIEPLDEIISFKLTTVPPTDVFNRSPYYVDLEAEEIKNRKTNAGLREEIEAIKAASFAELIVTQDDITAIFPDQPGLWRALVRSFVGRRITWLQAELANPLNQSLNQSRMSDTDRRLSEEYVWDLKAELYDLRKLEI